MFKTLFIIGLGSFCGGIFRFLLTRFVQNHFLAAFPFGTMIVNITGCLLIGIFYGLFERGNLLNTDLRLFLTVGLCGGIHHVLHFYERELRVIERTKLSIFYVLHGPQHCTGTNGRLRGTPHCKSVITLSK